MWGVGQLWVSAAEHEEKLFMELSMTLTQPCSGSLLRGHGHTDVVQP